MDVLTVGDGDLSFSLALQRAYPAALRVHPSTLVATREELVSTYPDSARVIDELEQVWKCPVRDGVDATRLDDANSLTRGGRQKDNFALVLFNHPHLGDLSLVAGDEGGHADRHHALLAHYFHSARSLLKVGGAVHVCLCGTQPSSWRVRAAAERCGLVVAAEEGTAVPVGRWIFGESNRCDVPEMAEALPHYPVKRKFRNGSLGSKHALARYGYRHRRTEGESYRGQTGEISVEQSVNFVFRSADAKTTNVESDDVQSTAAGECDDDRRWTCRVCQLKFASREDLEAHESSPALPDVATGGFERKAEMKRTKMPSKASDERKPDESKKSAAAFKGRALAELDNPTIVARGTVTSDLAGSRIRWLCRQKAFPLSRHVPSKKRVDDAVKRGSIFVNEVVCVDTARILNAGDTVTLVEESGGGTQTSNTIAVAQQDDAPSSGGADNSRVRLVESFDFGPGTTLRVMFKPVGVRCVGSFSEDTLEMQTKSLADLEGDCPKNIGGGVKCLPISKVDTGVGGLCVLATGPADSFDPDPLQSLAVTYTFTALVHGRPDWGKGGVYCRIPTEGVRQWKKRKAPEQFGDDPSEAGTGDEAVVGEPLNLDGALHLQCLDSLRLEDGHVLSTISARSSFDSGRLANVISYTLRSRLGLHVVNDRFSKREFAALPRRMRNLVRQSVCMGCYAVDMKHGDEALLVSIHSHQRTRCGYWRKILDVS